MTSYVYECWMRDVPLYVGLTDNPRRRFREHRRKQPWYRVMTEFKITPYPDRWTAARAEGRRIAELQPANNRQTLGPNGRRTSRTA